ncbi:MAG: hypothetical protein HQK91_15185, partial [Nitrospirae bacterium]|nr:hypothetical protein [Nitrospirota bacterium]
MSDNVPITAYLEGQDIKPNGICCPTFLTKVNIINNKDGSLNITAPLIKKGVDINLYPVTVVIKKATASPIDCLYCVDACQDYTETITVSQSQGQGQLTTTTETVTIPPPMQSVCGSSCLEQLHWYQGSHQLNKGVKIVDQIIKINDHSSVTLKVGAPDIVTVAENNIRVAVKIPKICGMVSMTVSFEVSDHENASIYFTGSGIIPADNSLKHTYDYLNGTWEAIFPYEDNSQGFFPGEMITAFAVFEGTNQCNPMPIAYSYFETKCFTSGIIAGCGIIDTTGKIISGGPNHGLDNSWLNDNRLKWLVNFKGAQYWMMCSDFSKYQLGQRCIIYKNGIGTLQNGGLVMANKCRNTDKLNKPPKEYSEILTDSAVSYVLNPNS